MQTKKIITLVLVICVLILIGVALNYGAPGSQYIPNDSTKSIYTWKSGALKTKGNIEPQACALTSEKCKCNLSESSNSCIFNFTFTGLNHSSYIGVTEKSPIDASIIYNKIAVCVSNESDQIQDCSIKFTWDKRHHAISEVYIQLMGNEGVQTLIELSIKAK